MSCPNCGMPESEWRAPFAKNGVYFTCGSHTQCNDVFNKTDGCKKIAHLREMLLEALPYVQEEIHSFANNDITRKNIEDLAKRIENEVRK